VLFVGTHERQLDDKGRLALPAPFRSRLGDKCYLVFGDTACINVFPAPEFEAVAAHLKARVLRGEISLQQQRVVASSATLVSLDKQGRVNVDAALRAYAGLSVDQPVVVTGNFDVVEIWSPERFRQVHEVGTNDLAGDLGPLALSAQLAAQPAATSATSATTDKEDRGIVDEAPAPPAQ
jgi:MraZ protein